MRALSGWVVEEDLEEIAMEERKQCECQAGWSRSLTILRMFLEVPGDYPVAVIRRSLDFKHRQSP